MNFIEVNGGNKTQREICENVVHHMISKLLPRFRTLDITVDLVKIKSDAVGFCMMLDTNRNFNIELDKGLGIKIWFRHCVMKWFMSNSMQEMK